MKKTLIALSFVCAGALALADNPQYNSDWFSGIGAGATSIEDLKASNGAWSNLTADNASVADGALVLDLDETDAGEVEEATFAISTEGESGTAQTLSVTGVFNPISAKDLLAGTKMNEKNAQVGFAVVGAEAADGTMAYKYYAWVGAKDGATAEADWVELSELGAATDPEASTAVTIELNYWDANKMTATFMVGEKSATRGLTSAAAQNKKIASVSCTGSGTLKELKGLYQYAVAEVDGKKYATVDAAVRAAATSTDGTVTVVRDLQDGDTVVAANGVTIKADEGVTLAEGKVSTSDPTKEVKVVGGVVTVQTTTSILNAIKVGSGEAATQKGLMKNEANFRKFLNKHCSAYRAAGTTADAMKADIEAALNAEDSTSKRTLWQSYALGVEPDATLKMTQVAKDTATDGITLKFPGTPSGDFTIKYTVATVDGKTTTSETLTEAGVVKVPLVTGRYKVKVSFE